MYCVFDSPNVVQKPRDILTYTYTQTLALAIHDTTITFAQIRPHYWCDAMYRRSFILTQKTKLTQRAVRLIELLVILNVHKSRTFRK